MPELTLPDPPLGDEAIMLREWTLADVPFMTAACREERIQRFTLVPSPYGEDDARSFIERGAADRAAGTALALAIADGATQRPLGSVALQHFAWEHARAEIGYWVAPEARGAGIATRAVRLLSRHALTAMGLERIDLLPFGENHASQRVAERAGYVREGVMRSCWNARGRRVDLVMYSLVSGDLTDRGAAACRGPAPRTDSPLR